MLNVLRGLALATGLLAAVPALAVEPPAAVSALGPGMVGVYYPPPKAGGPVVLVLGGSEGGFQGSGGMAKNLASEGYGALALAYFGAGDLPKTLEVIPLETFTRAIDWLEARPEVGRRRVGLVGVSKGAEAALLVAARDRRVCAVVAGLPSSVAWVGVNPANYVAAKGSWTWQGQTLPFATMTFNGPPTKGIRTFYEAGLANAPADAVIPVEKIAGPVLLVSGRDDRLWPSTPMADAIIARLDAAKFRYAHTHLAYDAAGHAAFGKPWTPPVSPPPAAALAQIGGTVEGSQAARVDGWPKTLAFLGDNLKGKGCAPLK